MKASQKTPRSVSGTPKAVQKAKPTAKKGEPIPKNKSTVQKKRVSRRANIELKEPKQQGIELDNADDGVDADDGVEIESASLEDIIPPNIRTNYDYYIFDPKVYKYNRHKEIVISKPEERVTSEILTDYEYTEIVSIRAKQLEDGGSSFCDDTDDEITITDPIKLAELEISQKKCPLSILRMYNHTHGEIWQVNEMGIR